MIVRLLIGVVLDHSFLHILSNISSGVLLLSKFRLSRCGAVNGLVGSGRFLGGIVCSSVRGGRCGRLGFFGFETLDFFFGLFDVL